MRIIDEIIDDVFAHDEPAGITPQRLQTILRRHFDQRMFHLNEEEHQAFMAALDAPPRPEAVAALRKLFARPAPWER